MSNIRTAHSLTPFLLLPGLLMAFLPRQPRALSTSSA